MTPSDVGRRGRCFADHRLVLEGIAWRFRTGSPWRDVPVEFGSWKTLWKRHHRYSFDGTCQRILAGRAGAESSGNDSYRPVEPQDHASGRSRGGPTTKLHGQADECTDLAALSITAASRAGAPHAILLWSTGDGAARTVVTEEFCGSPGSCCCSSPTCRPSFSMRCAALCIASCTVSSACWR